MARAAEMFYRITDGIRVTVNPSYLTEHSDPDEPRHVYLYRIRIENVGSQPAQLLWRHWHIHDPIAGDVEVEGEGVVGLQPVVQPGGVHEYESFCVLQAPEGHMEGIYRFRRADGTLFDVAIPRFQLRRATA